MIGNSYDTILIKKKYPFAVKKVFLSNVLSREKKILYILLEIMHFCFVTEVSNKIVINKIISRTQAQTDIQSDGFFKIMLEFVWIWEWKSVSNYIEPANVNEKSLKYGCIWLWTKYKICALEGTFTAY